MQQRNRGFAGFCLRFSAYQTNRKPFFTAKHIFLKKCVKKLSDLEHFAYFLPPLAGYFSAT
ncbi:hypothetical protein C7N43_07345 [Sphingobacteriales bacterium UPWRP_1]|nr:hypothetical protein B6N25_05185 [Sphingobacteriales bacterium TSM_CSS]PSJ77688.1 hypothetical protein C7N43_07345 [Sphingobacteriales bacterium UPWRP_1]